MSKPFCSTYTVGNEAPDQPASAQRREHNRCVPPHTHSSWDDLLEHPVPVLWGKARPRPLNPRSPDPTVPPTPLPALRRVRETCLSSRLSHSPAVWPLASFLTYLSFLIHKMGVLVLTSVPCYITFHCYMCVCAYSLCVILLCKIIYTSNAIILHELLYLFHMKQMEKEVKLAWLKRPRNVLDFILFRSHIYSMQVLPLSPFHR